MKIRGVERAGGWREMRCSNQRGRWDTAPMLPPHPPAPTMEGPQGEHGGYQRIRWQGWVSPSSTARSSIGCFYDNFLKSRRVACYKDGCPPNWNQNLWEEGHGICIFMSAQVILGYTNVLGSCALPFSPQSAPNWRTDREGAETDLSCVPLSQLVIPPWLDLTDPVDHSHHYWVELSGPKDHRSLCLTFDIP